MSDFAKMTKIYIIESSSFIDILDKRNEGTALSEILNLAKIKNEIYQISDEETFRIALDRIAKNLNEIKKDIGGAYIHFSLHGSKNGIELSNKTFLEWKTFYDIIRPFNDSIGYIATPKGLKIIPTYLIFSVCNGYYASTIKEFGEESPYSALVGPVEPVNWSDSLLAFSIFYHNIIFKEHNVIKALKKMNESVGLENIFQLDLGKGIKLIE